MHPSANAARAVGHQGMTDQQRALEAVSSGQAAPIAQVLAFVRKVLPGDVLDVTLDQTPKGDLIYKISLLTKAGEYCDVLVDAKRVRLSQVTYR